MNTVEKLELQNGVNMENRALLFQKRLVNLRHQHIRDIMSDYIHVSGRMEYVATVCGVDFINDTKADNLNAVWYSLESMTKPVIWIIAPPSPPEGGGVAPHIHLFGGDWAGFEKIVPLLKKKVKAVILLGDDKLRATSYELLIQHKPPLVPPKGEKAEYTELHRASNSLVSNSLVSNGLVSNYVERVYKAHHIEHAVELAYTVGIPGDAVLFSPAGGEHNENYKHNGDLFSAAVKKL